MNYLLNNIFDVNYFVSSLLLKELHRIACYTPVSIIPVFKT